jgi:hypothetical protein
MVDAELVVASVSVAGPGPRPGQVVWPWFGKPSWACECNGECCVEKTQLKTQHLRLSPVIRYGPDLRQESELIVCRGRQSLKVKRIDAGGDASGRANAGPVDHL